MTSPSLPPPTPLNLVGIFCIMIRLHALNYTPYSRNLSMAIADPHLPFETVSQ